MLFTSRDRASLFLRRLKIDSALHAAFLIGYPRIVPAPAATATIASITLRDQPTCCWSFDAPGGMMELATFNKLVSSYNAGVSSYSKKLTNILS